MELKTIQSRIYEIRGLKVMLDFDLADLYQVQTKSLNQAVKRNIKRFPEDFMFQLVQSEWADLQQPRSFNDGNRSQFVTSYNENFHQKHRTKIALPYAFTEQGVSMLSSILRSEKAIEVNIAIMRAFVLMRQFALSHKDLSEKLSQLEARYDMQFKDVYDAINFLLQKEQHDADQKDRNRIGFKKA